jgi:DNA-binding PadR family transcriptional regulator
MFRAPRFFLEHEKGRFFEKGDVKYFVLHLLRDKPKHGYEIIKEIEQAFGGFYSPSPGAIYPTLQMLEDLDYVRSTVQDGKRVYQITEEGRRFLGESDHLVDEIKQKISEFWGPSFQKDVATLAREFREFAHLFSHGMRNVREDPERLRKIRDVMQRAQKEILQIMAE